MTAVAGYTIEAGASAHPGAIQCGQILIAKVPITINNTPSFVAGFASVNSASQIASYGCTFTGSATGNRYVASSKGIIGTNGSGPNYFPGNTAGVTATGGKYL